MSVLGAFNAVLSGRTSPLAFAFKNRSTFSMDHCQPSPLKLKQCHHNTRLACQAPRGDELHVHAPSSKKTPMDDELHVHGPSVKTAVAPRVGIIMGSDTDLHVMKSAAEILEMFGVPYEVRIISAHRTPKMMYSYATSAHDRGIQVIIAGAGGSAHLPGMVASHSSLPVIGVPVRAAFLGGLDSFLSMVQMPKGVPVAIVAVDNATNAGLLAMRMLGVTDDNLPSRMNQYEENSKEIFLWKGEKLEKHVAPRVGIIMGSESDLSVMKSAVEILEMFGVPHEVRIVSAHDTPEMIYSYASSAHDRDIKFIIVGADGSSDLPGMVTALTPLPVIGVPVIAPSPNELDSLLSFVQKPKVVPIATVAINNATNAGLLAVRLFGVSDNNLLSRMSQYEEDQTEIIMWKGDKLEKYGWQSYLTRT